MDVEQLTVAEKIVLLIIKKLEGLHAGGEVPALVLARNTKPPTGTNVISLLFAKLEKKGLAEVSAKPSGRDLAAKLTNEGRKLSLELV